MAKPSFLFFKRKARRRCLGLEADLGRHVGCKVDSPRAEGLLVGGEEVSFPSFSSLTHCRLCPHKLRQVPDPGAEGLGDGGPRQWREGDTAGRQMAEKCWVGHERWVSVLDSASGMDLFFSDEGCLQICINKLGTACIQLLLLLRMFLFSSQTDFIHTVYLAVHDRIWSLVPFGKKSSLILVSSPHISQTNLEK